MASHLASMRASRKVDAIRRRQRLGGSGSTQYLRMSGRKTYDKSTSIARDRLHRPQS